MKIIAFDIIGKFAHFRKYFSNSTALSYTIPPRTTIIGILAAVMGYQKDAYYQCFSKKNLQITIAVISPLKKTIHRVNNLRIVSRSFDDFMGHKLHTQTPIEIVTPEDLQNNNLAYRVYILPEDIEFREELIIRLTNKKAIYNTSLGVAQFSASIQNITIFNDNEIEELNIDGCNMEFNSAVLSSSVNNIIFELAENWKYNYIEEDLIPMDFMCNYNRELKELNRVLYTTNYFQLRVNFTGNYFQLSKNGEVLNIQFL
ncbi:MAG: CRISPR-associated protein Cas5 [bacterium]